MTYPSIGKRGERRVKVVISLQKVPLTVQIEGKDDAMTEIGTVLEQVLASMKRIWLESLKKQTKLMEEKK